MLYDQLVHPNNSNALLKWEFNGSYWHCIDEYGLEWVYDNKHFGALDETKKFLVFELDRELRFKNLETNEILSQAEYESLNKNSTKHADPIKTEAAWSNPEENRENKPNSVENEPTEDSSNKEKTDLAQRFSNTVIHRYKEENKDILQKTKVNPTLSKQFSSKVLERENEALAQYYSLEVQNAKLNSLVKQIRYICRQFLICVNYTKKKSESDRLLYIISKNLLFFFKPYNTHSKLWYSILAERFNLFMQENNENGAENIDGLKKKLIRNLKLEVVKCQSVLDCLNFDDNNATDTCVQKLLTLYKLLLHRAILENKEVRTSS